MAKQKLKATSRGNQWADDLADYITSETSSEDASDYKATRIFRELFDGRFTKETDAEGADGYVEGQMVVEL